MSPAVPIVLAARTEPDDTSVVIVAMLFKPLRWS